MKVVSFALLINNEFRIDMPDSGYNFLELSYKCSPSYVKFSIESNQISYRIIKSTVAVLWARCYAGIESIHCNLPAKAKRYSRSHYLVTMVR